MTGPIIFDQRESKYAFKAAMDHADAGGQALHIWEPTEQWKRRAPLVFRQTTPWAHLIDRDKDRLIATARRYGVNVVKVGRAGERGQHIDLCGAPLRRAMTEAPTSKPTPSKTLVPQLGFTEDGDLAIVCDAGEHHFEVTLLGFKQDARFDWFYRNRTTEAVAGGENESLPWSGSTTHEGARSATEWEAAWRQEQKIAQKAEAVRSEHSEPGMGALPPPGVEWMVGLTVGQIEKVREANDAAEKRAVLRALSGDAHAELFDARLQLVNLRARVEALSIVSSDGYRLLADRYYCESLLAGERCTNSSDQCAQCVECLRIVCPMCRELHGTKCYRRQKPGKDKEPSI